MSSGSHGDRRWGFPYLSIRWTLFTIYAVVVLVGSGMSLYLGFTLSTEAVIGEAQRRVEMDLNSAWAQYNNELERVHATVKFVSLIQKTHDVLNGVTGDGDWVRQRLEDIRRQSRLDILTIAALDGRVVMRTRYPYRQGDTVYVDPVVQRALRQEAGRGTVIVPAAVLEIEGQYLKEQAFMDVKETAMAAPSPKRVETDGMMLKAAEPVHDDSGRVIGFVYGGVVLNRNYTIPDAIRDTIFKNESYKGKPLGTVTLFQGDVRVATNVLNQNGTRAIGTRVMKAVNDVVLENGRSYYDRAFVVNDWYLTAYDPIRDPDGRVVGILYVGLLERKFLDYKDRLINSYVGMMLVGMAVALALALAFAVWLSRPIKRLTVTASEVATGNFGARVREGGELFKEIRQLNHVFNTMADNIVKRGNELYAANRDLQKSNLELTQLNQNYMDVLEFVTHELKSPLSSAVFSICSLKEGYFGPLTGGQRKLLDSMEKNVEYLNEMILNYLNLSRIEKNELQFSPEPISFLHEVAEPVMEQVRRQAEAHEMKVACAVPEEVTVEGDADLLKIVMDNLLSNAVKYGKPGSEIQIGYQRLSGGARRFNVRNEGCGISPQGLGKLFKKFSRLNIAELRAKKGTGLGLFITREIVERHHGQIYAESKEGEWANFYFDLPAHLSARVEPAGPVF